MKLSTFELDKHLMQNLSPLYIVSGDEFILKQDILAAIRKKAHEKGFYQPLKVHLEKEQQAEMLHTVLYHSSLMLEKQLIEIHCYPPPLNKASLNLLCEYSAAPSSTQVVVILTQKLDPKIVKDKAYLTLEKNSITITLWPITRDYLPKWILQRAKQHSLTLSLSAAHLLAEYTEGNLSATVNALEKITLFQGASVGEKKIIDDSLLKHSLDNESQFGLFDFIEHLIAGDVALTLRSLRYLQEEGTEPALIIWAIARELRLIATLHQEQLQTPLEKLFQKHHIFARRQQSMRQFLKNVSLDKCWHALSQMNKLDEIIKGVVPEYKVWEPLENFCLDLHGL